MGFTFDHQGTIGQGSENFGGFGRIEGMDFTDPFFHITGSRGNVEGGSSMGMESGFGLNIETDQRISSFTDSVSEQSDYETQAQTWDEGMSILLADLEGRISEGQGQGLAQQEVWNPESWVWETVPV